MPRVNHVAKARKTKSGNRPTCGKCGKVIEIGMPYLWWANRTTYSSSRKDRCVDHPPRASELTMSQHKGTAYGIQESLTDALNEAGTVADISTALEDAASTARDELYEGLIESSDNIVEGFGHETTQSEELRERADAAETWAGEFDGAASEVEGLTGDDAEDDDDLMDQARQLAEGASEGCPE
jgi:hypothetical protein